MTYNFGDFTLEYNKDTGWVNTTFPDKTWSGCLPSEDDKFHGNLLGITSGEHRLIHELSHHLVGIAYGNKWCTIVRASALHKSMPDNAAMLEWQITALYYFALEVPMRDPNEWRAIGELAKVSNIYELSKRLFSLYIASRYSDTVDVK